MEVVKTIGRRKSAIARAYLSEGTGKITINKRDYKDFFTTQNMQYLVEQPLRELDKMSTYDIKVTMSGGGVFGQAEALRLAIARALVEINPEDKKQLKDQGFLVRDPREVERKKPGQKKARKKFQFSKR
ncbi:30S ribosomal protein S9 [Salinivirga cyanobacteriivorans]|uniref:30S ribosomal protein S9 n=1 Tax=Salinivirga cyanobacteriivorans TaxID=1307839 RepID=A0A0S2I1Q2_9BACT|nr:30S ribosomal protein S9 [Salinivirga cyanobacteriivorans]ALO15964.1 30S ribosomal protein S9 [Salinivirga cyanobacteriivorans]